MPQAAMATADRIAARIERLPLSRWHFRIGTIIGSGWFFDGFDALAIAYVLPALIGLWKLGPRDIGLLISIGYAGQAIGSVFFGWLAERIGRVPCALYTLLIFTCMSFACAFAWNYDSLLAMRFLQGLGLGGEIPIMATYINEFAQARRRGRFSLSYQILFSIGLFAVAFVGSRVVPLRTAIGGTVISGWQWMFMIGAVPALLALPLRRLLPESPRWLASRGRLDDADRVLQRIEDDISRGGAKPLPPIADHLPRIERASTRFGDLFKGIYLRRTLSVWVIWVTTYLIIYGLNTWMPSVWRSVYHLPVQQALNYGFAQQAIGLCFGVSTIVLIDILGRKAIFTGGLLASAAALLLLSGHTDMAPERILILVALGTGCSSPLALSLSTYTAEIYPTELRALGCGVGNAWLRLASVAAPIFIGWILPIAGIAAVFLVMGIGAVIGGAVALLFATETRGKVLEQLSPTI